ncbi:MAG: glycyl-radical enzyme activating protein [Chloroflexota bacterium]
MPEAPGQAITGTVFNIQRYSIHDGPGIRTLVFLKGCPLQCAWCCNPESQRQQPEVQFLVAKCGRCGACVGACPLGAVNPDLALSAGWKIDRVLCDACGRCAAACPNGALVMSGQTMSAAAVVEMVKRDARFYRRSHGGVTLSGGEPLLQSTFAAAILRGCYAAGIHTALETCGASAWEDLAAVLPVTDLVLFDLKVADPARHKVYTGAGNATILANLRRLAASHVSLIVRIPLIPGYNDDAANLHSLAGLAREVGALEVNLMPFHQLGKEKYRRLDRPYALEAATDLLSTPQGRAAVQEARGFFEAEGLSVFIGG